MEKGRDGEYVLAQPAKIRGMQRQADEAQKAVLRQRLEEEPKPTPFELGDLVLLQPTPNVRCSKLQPKYDLPLKIAEKHSETQVSHHVR